MLHVALHTCFISGSIPYTHTQDKKKQTKPKITNQTKPPQTQIQQQPKNPKEERFYLKKEYRIEPEEKQPKNPKPTTFEIKVL